MELTAMKQDVKPNDKLMQFYANQVEEAMDRLWEEGKWDAEKNETVLKEHLRTSCSDASCTIETMRQKILVKESLSQAFKELREAEQNGIELPDACDLFK